MRWQAQVARVQPYLPLIVGRSAATALPDNAIPSSTSADSQAPGGSDRLVARLRAALRVRSLHATVMRRLDPAARDGAVGYRSGARCDRAADRPRRRLSRCRSRSANAWAWSARSASKRLPSISTPATSTASCSAKVSPRVVDAFLTVLTEDARFRNLPVVVTSTETFGPAYELAQSRDRRRRPDPRGRVHCCRWCASTPSRRIWSRTLRALDANGLIDARTGLLTREAFERDFASADLPEPVARRRVVDGALCVRSRPSPRAVRRRTDHQPPDAPEGFRRGAGRRFRRSWSLPKRICATRT